MIRLHFLLPFRFFLNHADRLEQAWRMMAVCPKEVSSEFLKSIRIYQEDGTKIPLWLRIVKKDQTQSNPGQLGKEYHAYSSSLHTLGHSSEGALEESTPNAWAEMVLNANNYGYKCA